MTQHRDHRSIVHPSRPAVPAPPGGAAPVPVPRLLVQGAGDGLSLRLAGPR